MLKIYTQDHGWSGMIVAIAKDEASARKLMEAAPNYYDRGKVDEHEIKEGFMEYNLGDG